MDNMITTHVADIAKKRGIKSSYQLQKFLGVYPSLANRLWHGDFVRIDFETLNKLCEKLQCTPGQLIKFKGEPAEPTAH